MHTTYRFRGRHGTLRFSSAIGELQLNYFYSIKLNWNVCYLANRFAVVSVYNYGDGEWAAALQTIIETGLSYFNWSASGKEITSNFFQVGPGWV